MASKVKGKANRVLTNSQSAEDDCFLSNLRQKDVGAARRRLLMAVELRASVCWEKLLQTCIVLGRGDRC